MWQKNPENGSQLFIFKVEDQITAHTSIAMTSVLFTSGKSLRMGHQYSILIKCSTYCGDLVTSTTYL